jgi:primosomal protein N' (replication factor Y)
MIVVDEEHDSSFKQDDRCKFSARDVAIKKAQIYDIPVFMGSATPSIESYYRHQLSEQKDKNFYFELKSRFNKSKLPDITVIPNGTNDDYCWPLNPKCIKETDDVLASGGKVIYFVNKLGYAKYLQCQECGHDFECLNCSIPLTYFKKSESLDCRHCHLKVEVPRECPKCGCLDIDNRGFGTEKVEALIKSIYPETAVVRFDRDEIKKLSDMNRALDNFDKDEPAIMIGTQMLSKGHNFKNVKLVIVLGVDNQFHYPDFRSNERIYQLVTQVAGRAGRFGGNSKVLIQSNIESPLFEHIIKNDLHNFYQEELKIREFLKLPPYEKLVKINFIANNVSRAKADSEKAFARLEETIKDNKFDVQLKGPRSQYTEKIKNTFCWKIILNAKEHGQVNQLLNSLKSQFKCQPGVRMQFDVDPYFMD